jgi:16S rRNA (guanine527-N7)-methyltransferase
VNREELLTGARQLDLELSPEILSQFDVFEADLYDQNLIMNLTRIQQDQCVQRHFLDSLLISHYIGDDLKVLDIGCGPGFPSWPLACARPDLTVTALDSNAKMLRFLRRHPLDNLIIINTRAEDWGRRDYYDLATGRAVAPLAIQLELSAPTVKLGGLCIPMRTSSDTFDSPEFKDLGLELVSVEKMILGDTERVFPIYKKVKSTPKKYPRRWDQIKKKPLA